MGLETASFISGLTAAWPLANDKKLQGDDHLRLIKSVLQGTFPTASKPFYFPTTEAVSGTITLDATDQNNTLYVDTTAGSITVNLPAGFTTAEKGWKCTVVKSSGDVNGAIVTPPSGSIVSRVGSTATVRVGVLFEPAIFEWSGAAWLCYKPGTVIGATYNFDGPTNPAGFLDLDGSSFNSTNFAELFAVLGSSVLKDKRGRVDIGSGTGAGLTARTLGATYGTETFALATGNLPAYTPTGTITIGSLSARVHDMRQQGGGVAVTDSLAPGSSGMGSFGAQVAGAIDLLGTMSFTGNAQGGVSTPVDKLSAAIASKKIIRAC